MKALLSCLAGLAVLLGACSDPAPPEAAETGAASRVRIPDEDGTYQFYEVENLYIVNGELLHRDWFFNTSLGNIAAAMVAQP